MKPVGYAIPYYPRNTLEDIAGLENSYKLKLQPTLARATGTEPIDISFVLINANQVCSYVANQGSNDVSSFITYIDPATPSLTLSRIKAGASPSGVGMDFRQSNRFVYVTNFGDSTISRYSYDPATCQLTALGVSPTLASPSQVRVFGKYAVVASYPNKLQLYEINLTDGSLSAKGTALATGADPYFMFSFSADTTFTFIATANETGNSISTFSLDNLLGTLQSFTPDVIVGSGPQNFYSIALPNGQFLMYVLNRTGRTITTLRYDAPTKNFVRLGPDVPTQANPFRLTNNPRAAIGDRYIYAFHDDINTITAYEVNQETGALKALGSAL